LRDYIIKRINEELDADFVPCTEKFGQAFHETVNPLGIWKNFFVKTPIGLRSEEELIKKPMGNQALNIIKARSLDCRIMPIT
jgi:predicted transcriptional regulator